MPDFLQPLLAYAMALPPLWQGVLIGLLVTGIPGPLNVIALNQTLRKDSHGALINGFWFAGMFASVAGLAVFFTYTPLEALPGGQAIAPLITKAYALLKTYGRFILLGVGTAFGIAGFIMFRNEPRKPLPHATGVLRAMIVSGILFNPGNWVVYLTSYGLLMRNQPTPDPWVASATLIGIFALCMGSWLFFMVMGWLIRLFLHHKLGDTPDITLRTWANKVSGVCLALAGVGLILAALYQIVVPPYV